MQRGATTVGRFDATVTQFINNLFIEIYLFLEIIQYLDLRECLKESIVFVFKIELNV